MEGGKKGEREEMSEGRMDEIYIYMQNSFLSSSKLILYVKNSPYSISDITTLFPSLLPENRDP